MQKKVETNPEVKNPTLLLAFIPIAFLILFLSLNVYYFRDDTLSGANQIALLLASAIAGIIAIYLGHNWYDVRAKVVQSIGSAMPSMLILLLIGSLAGTWLISGVVPAMIYYGLKILHPNIFLFASVVICSLVSLATGSSWSTVATIGIALLGIGNALGLNEGLVAGAVISGAYFGDKMSPLSDTTNLAPAMAGTDLFTHIKYMMYTTGPTLFITLVAFLVIGFSFHFENVETSVQNTLTAIEHSYNITPVLFIVPAFLIFIIIKKTPPLPSLLAGTLMGGIFAIIFQPHIIEQISGVTDNYAEASYIAVMKAMYGRISIITEDIQVNDLLSTGGMAGMLNTIWLIITAMTFGGIMESAGLLEKITQKIIGFAKSTGSLVAATVSTCIFFNVTASDQYLSIVVPGRMFAKTYRDRGLKPELLSRTLEDSGTVTSVLVPWNTCGATQSAVLGVPTVAYIPYAIFCWLSPITSVFMASFNIRIRRFSKEEMEENRKIDLKE